MLALETMKTEIVAYATQSARHMDARYAGNYELRQAFFCLFFVIANCPAEWITPKTNRGHISRAQCVMAGTALLVVRKIIRRQPGRRTKHLVPSNRRPAATAWREFVLTRIR